MDAKLTRFLVTFILVVLGPAALCAGQTSGEADGREAKRAFGAVQTPLNGASPQAIGPYDHGCVAGASKLPQDGAEWQVMRLSRNRFWGHPVLIAAIRRFATEARKVDGWPGILVGDMAQPIGGPLLGGHASHQTGLDADLWYMPMPSHTLSSEEREQISALSMVDRASLTVNKAVWSEGQVKLLKRIASYTEVARIFVHPAIKKALCDAAGADRAWLQKIRPWYQHDDHFHIRLNCPPGSPACVAQSPAPAGDDGCGEELGNWFKKLRAAPKKPTKPSPPPKPVLVSDMPKECQTLLLATEQNAKMKAASQ